MPINSVLISSVYPQPPNTPSSHTRQLHEDIQPVTSEAVDQEGLDVVKKIHCIAYLGEECSHFALDVLDTNTTKTGASEKRI